MAAPAGLTVMVVALSDESMTLPAGPNTRTNTGSEAGVVESLLKGAAHSTVN